MSRKTRIEETLASRLSPTHLHVIDESSRHNVPAGAESHFKVLIVSSAFGDQPLIARHRLVHGLLGSELQHGLHALAIHAWTPDEWQARGEALPDSPPCRGGSKVNAA